MDTITDAVTCSGSSNARTRSRRTFGLVCHELGPIALALVKRNVPVDAALTVDEMPAAQEVVVDPEVGLHVRPLR